MKSAIVVHPNFDRVWPFAADHAHARWSAEGEVLFFRLDPTDTRPIHDVLPASESVERLIALGVPFTEDSLFALPALRELVCTEPKGDTLGETLAARGVRRITHPSEGFWAQSVSEFGLALTLCGLRRIPQTHHEMITSLEPWRYDPPGGIGRPGARGQQFGDDPRFIGGTIAGKRVRIVGAGNIASRYASFVHMMGADVAAWDPFASEPCFHRAGSRREYHLDRLMTDAEIFAPMVPLTEKTRGLITAAHIDSLPQGCLVVLVTRADICDVDALRRRVCADEIALAADVFDVEPLPLGDPLLGRHNVVHTPHNAGRTRDSNEQWTEALLVQFTPRTRNSEPAVDNQPMTMTRATLADLPTPVPMPSGIEIRPMRGQAEAAPWTAVQRDAEPFFAIADDLFAREFGTDDLEIASRCLVAADTATGEIVGAASAWHGGDTGARGADWGRLHWVAVRPTYQRRGIARALVMACLHRMAEMGHEKVYLSTSSGRVGAIALYKDVGFTEDRFDLFKDQAA